MSATKAINNNCIMRQSVRTDLFDALLQVVFEGIRGGGSKSDIAIDDISVASGQCAAPG